MSSPWSWYHRKPRGLRLHLHLLPVLLTGRKLSVTDSLATVAPEVAAQWHLTKNGASTPADLVANSCKKYWFTCDAGPDHE